MPGKNKNKKRKVDNLENSQENIKESQIKKRKLEADIFVENLTMDVKERERAYRQLSIQEDLELILGFNDANIDSWLSALTRSGKELTLGDIEKELQESTASFINSLDEKLKNDKNVLKITENTPVYIYATLIPRKFEAISAEQEAFVGLAKIGSMLQTKINDLPKSSGVGSPGFTKDNVDNKATKKSALETAKYISDEILGVSGEKIRQRIREFKNDKDYRSAKDDAGDMIVIIDFLADHLREGEVHAIGLGNDVLAASWIEGKRYARSYDDIVGDIEAIDTWDKAQKSRIIAFYAGFTNVFPEGIAGAELKTENGARLREFAAIQVAERGRELKRIEESGNTDKEVVKTALDKAEINGFSETYSGRNTSIDAPFAEQRGQEALRDLYTEELEEDNG